MGKQSKKESQQMNTVSLDVGDWSRDGHNQFDVYTIETNLTQSELEKAYKKGCKVFGEDICATYCEEYEDNSLPVSVVKKLREFGFSQGFDDEPDDLDDEDVQDENVSVYSELFFEIYMFIAKLGEPTLEFKRLDDQYDTIHIGGYGLFH